MPTRLRWWILLTNHSPGAYPTSDNFENILRNLSLPNFDGECASIFIGIRCAYYLLQMYPDVCYLYGVIPKVKTGWTYTPKVKAG